MENCIFCKIAKNELPSYKIYEDGQFLSFLDVNPVKPGHALVISKKHYKNFSDTPNEVLGKMMDVINKVSKAVMKATNAPAFNLMLNNGAVAGQIIYHVHFHIIPRHEDDNLILWPGKKYNDGEAENLLKKIKENL